MTEQLLVFVNSERVRVAWDATVLDAVRAWSAAAAADVEGGQRSVTDSRGLPIPLDAVVHGGAIFRLVSARDRGRGGDREPSR